MSAPLAVILEGTVEDDCPEVEAAELRTNSDEIGRALEAIGYRTAIVSLTLDVNKARVELEKLKPSVVFNLVDSIEGMGNLISIAPLLLEHLGLPFTGDGSMTTAITSHKLVTKQVLRGYGIVTPRALSEAEIEADGPELDRPYILKSVTEHASFGLSAESVVQTRAALRARLEYNRREYWGEWFAEEFIDGREFNCGVIASGIGARGRALPPAELVFTSEFPQDKPKIVDYAAKWHKETAEYKGSVRNFDYGKKDAGLIAKLEKTVLQCWDIFSICGYARVDFRIDAQGNPYVLEINSNPFLTADEGFGMAARQAGLSFNDAIRAIVADAYRRAARPLPEMLAA